MNYVRSREDEPVVLNIRNFQDQVGRHRYWLVRLYIALNIEWIHRVSRLHHCLTPNGNGVLDFIEIHTNRATFLAEAHHGWKEVVCFRENIEAEA